MLCAMYTYLNSHPPWRFSQPSITQPMPASLLPWVMISPGALWQNPLAHVVTCPSDTHRSRLHGRRRSSAKLHRWDEGLQCEPEFIQRTKAHDRLCESHLLVVGAEHTMLVSPGM